VRILNLLSQGLYACHETYDRIINSEHYHDDDFCKSNEDHESGIMGTYKFPNNEYVQKVNREVYKFQ